MDELAREMKFLRLVLGVIVGLMAITIVAETIEFGIVKVISRKSFDFLQANRDEYFAVRNKTWILVVKIGYSMVAGIFGGYITTWISRGMSRIAIYVLIFIQVASLIWGGFISELSKTGPTWMWIYLVTIIPLAVWVGHRWRVSSRKKSS